MTRKKWILLLYIFDILFFSVLYYLMFYSNTSTFIVDSEFNQKTYSFVESYGPKDTIYQLTDPYIPLSILGFNELVSNYNLEIIKIKNRKQKLNDVIIPKLSCKTDSLSYLYNRSVLYKTEQMLDSIHLKYKNKKDSIAIGIENITDTIKIENLIKLADFKISEAKMNCNVALEKRDVMNYALKYRGFIGNSQVFNEITEADQSIIDAHNLIIKYAQDIRDIYRLISDKTIDFHDNRLLVVSYWDFLYFSTMISTSNNFGDIRPNCTSVRILITVQIFVSIILLSLFLDSLLSRHRN